MEDETEQTDRELLEYLKRPEGWPHRPPEVRHLQTHASHLFLAGSLVYKIKKPVDYGFLDYSTLEKRKRFCFREVELNRRLSSGVYRGVAAIRRTGDRFTLPSPEETADEPRELSDGNAVSETAEYAVVMNRLPEEGFLINRVKRGTLTREQMERVVRKLFPFYRQGESSAEILDYGRLPNIRFNIIDNLNKSEPFIGETVDETVYRSVRHYSERFMESRKALFRQRMEERRIADGHGDLHLEHIHLSDDRVQIYDCIEFNERFRYVDQAADLAFLSMDLDFHGYPGLARFTEERMSDELDDPQLEEIIPFYKCYRAWVRGKVNSLTSVEGSVSDSERKEAAERARRYFRLALRYALLGPRPLLLLFAGPVGSGKSTLADTLSDMLDIPRWSSDRIRKEQAGVPLQKRTPADRREDLYSTERSARTYGEMMNRAEEQMEGGGSVILDATFGDPLRRRRVIDRFGAANILFVEAHAPPELRRQRLESRESDREVISDARADDFDRLNHLYRPPEEIGWSHLVRVDTGRPLPETVRDLSLSLATRNAES